MDLNSLQELYQQCLSVKSAIPHPRIMGVIRECGGKMHMRESKKFVRYCCWLRDPNI